jgi:hypothetical protein
VCVGTSQTWIPAPLPQVLGGVEVQAGALAATPRPPPEQPQPETEREASSAQVSIVMPPFRYCDPLGIYPPFGIVSCEPPAGIVTPLR